MTMTAIEKIAGFCEQHLGTDVRSATVRAAARLLPDKRAAAGRLLYGIEETARHDAVSCLRLYTDRERIAVVEEAVRRLVTAREEDVR